VVKGGDDPDGAKWLDLLMLVLAGGRERDEVEWRSLLERADFRVESLENPIVATCR
jgi:hypothetical protein